jgi:hypothetical protein
MPGLPALPPMPWRLARHCPRPPIQKPVRADFNPFLLDAPSSLETRRSDLWTSHGPDLPQHRSIYFAIDRE